MSTWIAGKGTIPAVTTNADRIRAMTDEELAVFIRDQIIDRNIGIPSETWLDWLRQEAADDKLSKLRSAD